MSWLGDKVKRKLVETHAPPYSNALQGLFKVRAVKEKVIRVEAWVQDWSKRVCHIKEPRRASNFRATGSSRLSMYLLMIDAA
jgi:hypothetical protein